MTANYMTNVWRQWQFWLLANLQCRVSAVVPKDAIMSLVEHQRIKTLRLEFANHVISHAQVWYRAVVEVWHPKVPNVVWYEMKSHHIVDWNNNFAVKGNQLMFGSQKSAIGRAYTHNSLLFCSPVIEALERSPIGLMFHQLLCKLRIWDCTVSKHRTKCGKGCIQVCSYDSEWSP